MKLAPTVVKLARMAVKLARTVVRYTLFGCDGVLTPGLGCCCTPFGCDGVTPLGGCCCCTPFGCDGVTPLGVMVSHLESAYWLPRPSVTLAVRGRQDKL